MENESNPSLCDTEDINTDIENRELDSLQEYIISHSEVKNIDMSLPVCSFLSDHCRNLQNIHNSNAVGVSPFTSSDIAIDNTDEADGIISDIVSVMSRARSESEASLEYYCTDDANTQAAGSEGHHSQSRPRNDRHVQQSRRIPFWLWFVIAKCLGIKLHVNDRPIVATILYTLTFMSALGYVLSNWWFTAYDIVSDYTKTTVIDGTMSVLFSILWASFGVYANKLAYRLFSHKKFLNMLRLHSKTILKMNAAVVLFTLMLLFAVINDMGAFSNYKDETCITVSVEVIVCKLRYIMRVLLSIFAIIWNYLVAFVVISVCRTHVIGIRKFMQALEQDARVYEARFMGSSQHSESDRPLLEEYTWLDEDYFEELQGPGISDMGYSTSEHHSDQASSGEGTPSANTQISVGIQSPQVQSIPTASDVASELRDMKGSSLHSGSSSRENRPRHTPLMSNSEILFRYWKIQSRLRMSSVALQRWMISLISLVVIWLAMNLVLWLTYDPTLTDLANFFLPLGLLPLLSSAYAEVNQEGLRLLKFICLIEERLQLIFVLQNTPLQMTVYGFILSYSTITTAAFGVLLAFASKVLIQEINVPPKS